MEGKEKLKQLLEDNVVTSAKDETSLLVTLGNAADTGKLRRILTRLGRRTLYTQWQGKVASFSRTW